ncbi:MAG TPA: hypothetical protein VKX96_05820, partial [Chloroflexota bacterium]|nr:hypothetical protein [Chloroflexota bacterium]
DHYLGTQTGFVNPQGQNVYLNSIPGKVSTISASSLTITPNGSTQTRTFNITSNTWVVSRPHQGALSAFSPGDRVIVYVINNGNDAVAITGPRLMMGMTGGAPCLSGSVSTAGGGRSIATGFRSRVCA